MKKYFTLSNIIFIIGIAILLYKPSRSWIIRQISFSPTVSEVSESKQLKDYSIQLKGLNSEDINLKNLQGKVIFFNYWATWCPPCVAEFPMIQELYNDYKEKVSFILITSENWQSVSPFYKENNYNLPVYNLMSNPPTLLNQSNSIPSTYIIDKNGFIRVFNTGSADWNSEKFRKKLDELIEQ